jgi:hypothetical protein
MEAKLLAVFSSGVPLKVTALCRELDISRQTLYRYRRRFEAEGPAGLVERSRRPLTSRGRCRSKPRTRSGGCASSCGRTAGRRPSPTGCSVADRVAPSVATIHRVLVRRGMVTRQPHKRPKVAWQRFEWPRPTDAWQIDATCWALADGQTVWIMDVLDDHSRALVAARVDTGPTAKAAWDAFTTAVLEWGLPAHVMNDNGNCFTGRLAKHDTADFERMLRSPTGPPSAAFLGDHADQHPFATPDLGCCDNRWDLPCPTWPHHRRSNVHAAASPVDARLTRTRHRRSRPPENAGTA